MAETSLIIASEDELRAQEFANEFVSGDSGSKPLVDLRQAAKAAGMGEVDAHHARAIMRRPTVVVAVLRELASDAMVRGTVAAYRTALRTMGDNGAPHTAQLKAAEFVTSLGPRIMDMLERIEGPMEESAMPEQGKIDAVAEALAAALRSKGGA
jgi:hypothetical protein